MAEARGAAPPQAAKNESADSAAGRFRRHPSARPSRSHAGFASGLEAPRPD